MAVRHDDATNGPVGAAAAAPTPDRWGLLWNGFLALTLLLPTVYALLDAPDARHGAVTVGVVAVLVLWHWQTALRHPEWEGSPRMLVWFAGTLLLTGVLFGRHPSYVFLLYGLYPQVFGMLGRWGPVGAIVLTGTALWRSGLLTASDGSDRLVNLGTALVLPLLIGAFVTTVVRQTEARQRALEELEATRAELAETARRAGVLEERQRLAREIHDTVAQGFTGIVMQLEASEQALDDDPARARDHLVRARHSARESLGELRRAVHALRPEALVGATLPEALERTARRWGAASGVAAHCSVDGPPTGLAPDAEVGLLRAVQEALANVAKHAGASTASVRLVYAPERVEVKVTDDGAGFDPAVVDPGHGLTGIAERMAALDGSWCVESRPGAGTIVTAAVPAATDGGRGR